MINKRKLFTKRKKIDQMSFFNLFVTFSASYLQNIARKAHEVLESSYKEIFKSSYVINGLYMILKNRLELIADYKYRYNRYRASKISFDSNNQRSQIKMF